MIRSTRAAALVVCTILALLSVLLPWAAPALAQGENVVVINSGAVNVRSGPAANTTILGSVPGGTELAVTGRSANGQWWRVQSPFGVGWVSNLVVVFRGIFASVPVVSEPVGTLESATVIVDRFPATVYRNPNEDSFIIGIAPTGTTLTVIGRTADRLWWQVDTRSGSGFVTAGSVAFRGDAALVPLVSDPGPSFDGPTIRVNADTVVTTEPGGGTVLTTLTAGTAIPASGRSADNAWWQVAGTFGIGWIPVSSVSLVGNADSIRVVSDVTGPRGPEASGQAFAKVLIEIERKVAYSAPGFGSAPMWAAGLGQEAGVVARSLDGLWLKVAMDGKIGWMHFSGITLVGSLVDIPAVEIEAAPLPPDVAIVNIHRLNVRSGPGVEFTALGSLPGGTRLNVSGRHPTLPWVRVESPFGTGWVRIMHIIFRGSWDAIPQVTEPAGIIELPVGVVSIPRPVYHEAYMLSPAGELVPGTYTIIGRTSDYNWALLQTPMGQVWINYYHVTLRGIEAAIPVVQ
ncbi:MAG: SH3 domain-containing protein [Chloroflexi bacterium]|nr:SH3 domain-containing protein [Chloroflexota bacterium]